ncbi:MULTISPECIES: O-acetylhomoserine aminocarboxypropyltransferase/cysteine synthase family protein [Corynebacterium]|uniref:O-acetylhomoserine aminocarboxypropyltransferase/cysteine synthase family protein n=1 Tax=Corynebacterium TaxID=1716 RepID=UPI0008AA2548|nr:MULTISPECIES: O-acetylhomoserine aminocarboxypropyltransferase/cysteine synthase family protein [Corynebacterium]MBC6763201.1 O-acetylhomoserine aminocarboxypropyltransferase/cysteine synthase [Corynebacterium sp. LK27]MDK7110699.1 O-acetylhomoserine aminocarboxypropyltransferase/cysteine synthase [Corynebacterium amycolatum]MDK7145719.1 O-acetylhomoserine aminocarboxypropyltransferase/cysteine synthase [Corynebacterium amycolatum]OHR29886.1 O-acetylhomoserine aminocarboxypropyltransferase [
MQDQTKLIHSGYVPGNKDPRQVPIIQSTTYTFDSSDDIAAVFDEPTHALIYSRFANPTVMAVEEKIADLEGGAAAMATTSGQAATALAIMNLCSAGDSFVTSSEIYGGTSNLFATTLKRFGIEAIFVNQNASEEEIAAAFKPNTKALFGEIIANPAMSVLDVEKFARIAHGQGVPLIVDSTFATPILCKPIEHGADIVVHSTSKYMDGHAIQVGGVIVDSGKFDFTNGKFPDFTEPDESYHGVIYTKDYAVAPFVIKARMQLQRDFGAYPAAHSAFMLNQSLESLDVRMRRHCENALKVAEYLESRTDLLNDVRYPGLKSSPYYELAQKYLDGASGVVTIDLKGGREAGTTFMDALKLVTRQVHVADSRSCVLHPASTTHRQVPDEQLPSVGITPGLVRLSIGLENVDDIIADIEQALAKVES